MEPELLVDLDTAPVEQPGTVARLNTQSLERLDAAVATYVRRAAEFECKNAEDYAVGGQAVVAIRSLDKLYGDFFGPMKRWWDARKQEVLDDEKKRRGPLEAAKYQFAAKLLTWKQAEDERNAQLLRAREAEERRIAEERRLAEAEALERTGQREKALDILDHPLDIAPSIQPRTVPKVTGFKTVNRTQVLVTDVRQMLMSIGATLILQQPEVGDPAVRLTLARYANKSADGLLDDDDRAEAIAAAFVPFFRDVARVRGAAFAMPGVTVGKKEGIG